MEIGDAVTVGGDHHRLVLTEFDGIAGVLDECGHVGADEHLAVADTDNQRCGAACGDDHARLVGVGEDKREMALEPAQHREHGGREVACGVAVVVLPGDQMNSDLGIGVAGELHPRGFQLGAQRRVVFDDPVVHDRDLARGVAVRVGVAVGGPAVGCPASVTEPGAASETGVVCLVERGLQIGQPPRPASHRQTTMPVEQRDPGRVVTPVLHPAQRVDNDVTGRTLPDVADDSAHSHSG